MSDKDEFEAWADERSITGGNRRVARLAWQAARATQPSQEPKDLEHEHDWRFSLQDHVYKCACGATRGDYPYGAASFKD